MSKPLSSLPLSPLYLKVNLFPYLEKLGCGSMPIINRLWWFRISLIYYSSKFTKIFWCICEYVCMHFFFITTKGSHTNNAGGCGRHSNEIHPLGLQEHKGKVFEFRLLSSELNRVYQYNLDIYLSTQMLRKKWQQLKVIYPGWSENNKQN